MVKFLSTLTILSIISANNAFTIHPKTCPPTPVSQKHLHHKIPHNASLEEWVTTTASHPGRRRYIAKPFKYMFDYNKIIYETNVQKRILAVTMAMTTGLADITTYTKFQGFCTMMTGNLIWLGRSLADRKIKDCLYYSSLILSYVMGLVAFRKLIKESSGTSNNPILFVDKWKSRLLPKCAIMTITLSAIANISLTITGIKWISIAIMAFCFGIINSVGTHTTGSLTFVITGHLTKLTNEIIDYVSNDDDGKNNVDKGSMIQNASLILGFLVGAIIASFKIIPAGYEIMSIGLLYAISFLWKDRMEIAGAQRELTMAVLCDDASVPFDSIGGTISDSSFRIESEEVHDESLDLQP